MPVYLRPSCVLNSSYETAGSLLALLFAVGFFGLVFADMESLLFANKSQEAGPLRLRPECLRDHRARVAARFLDGHARAVEKRIEARGHDARRGDGFAVTVDEHVDGTAFVHEMAGARERIEITRIEDV